MYCFCIYYVRDCRPEVFCKKRLSKKLREFHSKQLPLEAWNLIKKRLQQRSFPENFVKLLRIPILKNTLTKVPSVLKNLYFKMLLILQSRLLPLQDVIFTKVTDTTSFLTIKYLHDTPWKYKGTFLHIKLELLSLITKKKLFKLIYLTLFGTYKQALTNFSNNPSNVSEIFWGMLTTGSEEVSVGKLNLEGIEYILWRLLNKVPRVPKYPSAWDLSAQVPYECTRAWVPKCLECPSGLGVTLKCPWSDLWVPSFPLSAPEVKKMCNITRNGLFNRFMEFLETFQNKNFT